MRHMSLHNKFFLLFKKISEKPLTGTERIKTHTWQAPRVDGKVQEKGAAVPKEESKMK